MLTLVVMMVFREETFSPRPASWLSLPFKKAQTPWNILPLKPYYIAMLKNQTSALPFVCVCVCVCVVGVLLLGFGFGVVFFFLFIVHHGM